MTEFREIMARCQYCNTKLLSAIMEATYPFARIGAVKVCPHCDRLRSKKR